jgi:hypothetical protein
MKRYVMLFLAVVAVLATGQSTARADDANDARPRDLQRLQEDLANLDAELAPLEVGDRRADEFRARGEEIREEVIYLKVKMRKHEQAGGAGTGVMWSEVQDLQRSIRNLRDDIDGAFGRSGHDLRLREGTEIAVRLENSLSSKSARLEDRFEASVVDPVRLDGEVAVPAGSRVRGVVRSVEPAHRPSQSGRLELQFDALYLDRTRLDISGLVSSVGEQKGSDTAKKAGIGAVLGGVLGGLLGGKDGAIVGVVLGGGGAVAGTRGDDVELPAGTILTVRLEKPLTIPRD